MKILSMILMSFIFLVTPSFASPLSVEERLEKLEKKIETFETQGIANPRKWYCASQWWSDWNGYHACSGLGDSKGEAWHNMVNHENCKKRPAIRRERRTGGGFKIIFDNPDNACEPDQN